MLVSDFGLTLEAPTGMYALLAQVVRPVPSPVAAFVSTHPLDIRGSFYAKESIDRLPADGFIFIVHSYGGVPGWVTRTADPVSPNSLSFSVADVVGLQGLPNIQVKRQFVMSDRYCEAFGMFGTRSPAASVFKALNSVASSLAVGASAEKLPTGAGVELDWSAVEDMVGPPVAPVA